MAFAYTIDRRTVVGNMRLVAGTFTNGAGDSGGDLVTGLAHVEFASLQETGSAVQANKSVINEAFPNAPGTLTIVTDLDADGVWMAIGK